MLLLLSLLFVRLSDLWLKLYLATAISEGSDGFPASWARWVVRKCLIEDKLPLFSSEVSGKTLSDLLFSLWWTLLIVTLLLFVYYLRSAWAFWVGDPKSLSFSSEYQINHQTLMKLVRADVVPLVFFLQRIFSEKVFHFSWCTPRYMLPRDLW